MSWMIPLGTYANTTRRFTIVDQEDYERFGSLRWCFSGHVALTTNTAVQLHREILGLVPGDGLEGDHINGDKLDNRRSNLRIATKAENGQNRPKLNANNTSGYRGVYWDKTRERWKAVVKIDYRVRHVGYFDDVDEAGRAAAAFRAEHMPFSVEARSSSSV